MANNKQERKEKAKQRQAEKKSSVSKVNFDNQKKKSFPKRIILAGGVFSFFLVLSVLYQGLVFGIGHHNLTQNELVYVENLNEAITKDDLQQEVAAQAKAGNIAQPSARYEKLQKKTLNNLILQKWIEGEAKDQGVEISEVQLNSRFQEIKETEFESLKEFKQFKKENDLDNSDLKNRVRLSLYSESLQNIALEKTEQVTDEAVESVYEDNLETSFTTPATRDARIIVGKKKDVEKAYKELSKDDSDENWEKVNEKYSQIQAEEEGAIFPNIQPEQLPEPINTFLFQAKEDKLSEPIESEEGDYFIFSVSSINSSQVQPLSAVRSQIEEQLTQSYQAQAISVFQNNFQMKWSSLTLCQQEVITKDCQEFEAPFVPGEAAVQPRAVINPGASAATLPGQPEPTYYQGIMDFKAVPENLPGSESPAQVPQQAPQVPQGN